MVEITSASLSALLTDLAPLVYLCGSYATGTARLNSDIDFCVRARPDYDPNTYDDEFFMPEVIKVLEDHNVTWGSEMIGIVHAPEAPGWPALEISYWFGLEPPERTWFVTVAGVELEAREAQLDKVWVNKRKYPEEARGV